MRVVFLTHNYPRYQGDVAGGFLHPLATALLDRGHDVRVVAPSDRGRGGVATLDGVEVTRVRYAAAGRERYAYTGRMEEALASPAGWLALARLIGALRREGRRLAAGDAVIHAHWWFPAAVAAPREVPAVVTMHGTDARLLKRAAGAWLARRALAGRVVTAVSDHVARSIEAATGRAVDAAHRSPMPAVLAETRSRGGAGLVFVGRLTSQKRLALALEAHALLVSRGRELPFVVVGDGPERAALTALAERLATARLIRFVGQVPTDRVAAAIGDADLFVFPAVEEGLGLAVVEALAAGVPVIACRDGGGVLDLVRDGAGHIVAPDPAAIAAGIEAALADPGLRTRAAEQGDTLRRRLSPAAVAERAEAWYREAQGG